MSSIWNPQDRFILSNMTSEKLYAKSPLTTGVSGTSAYIGLEPSATYNETVLWSGTCKENNDQINLSEPYTGFSTIKFYTKDAEFGNLYNEVMERDTTVITTANDLSLAGWNKWTFDNNINYTWIILKVNNDSKFTVTNHGLHYNTFGNPQVTSGNNRGKVIYKVVGINRKENV